MAKLYMAGARLLLQACEDIRRIALGEKAEGAAISAATEKERTLQELAAMTMAERAQIVEAERVNEERNARIAEGSDDEEHETSHVEEVPLEEDESEEEVVEVDFDEYDGDGAGREYGPDSDERRVRGDDVGPDGYGLEDVYFTNQDYRLNQDRMFLYPRKSQWWERW